MEEASVRFHLHSVLYLKTPKPQQLPGPKIIKALTRIEFSMQI